jgi:hypothetical protein
MMDHMCSFDMRKKCALHLGHICIRPHSHCICTGHQLWCLLSNKNTADKQAKIVSHTFSHTSFVRFSSWNKNELFEVWSRGVPPEFSGEEMGWGEARSSSGLSTHASLGILKERTNVNSVIMLLYLKNSRGKACSLLPHTPHPSPPPHSPLPV